jgi:hypothetical protein
MLVDLLQASKSSSLQVQAFEVEGASLLCEVSTGSLRPLNLGKITSSSRPPEACLCMFPLVWH